MCLGLGYPHPDFLLPLLSARQLKDWMQFARQYGLGVRRNDIFHGQLLAMFHNVHRAESTPTAKPLDYMPYHEPPAPSPDEIITSWRECMKQIKADSSK